MKRKITFTVLTTMEREFDIKTDRDIWDQVHDHVTSEEFLEMLKQGILDGSILWELEL